MSDTTGCALAAQPAARASAAPLWLLAMITLSGTLAMHIFVPALPMAGADLGASQSAMQLTLSAYIVGLALGQLTYGPVSDRFGRRPVLIVGMTVYAGASLLALLAPDVGTLIGVRFLQALGGCSGLVLGRAIVRDGYSGHEAARKLSLMNLMTMAGPGLAPLVGALLATATGWRSIFVFLTLLGLANLALVLRLLPEPRRHTDGVGAGTVLRLYGRLLCSRRFLGLTIGGGCATCALYAFIAAAPFIFVVHLHRSPREVGLYLMVNILGAWLGSLATTRLIGRVATGRLMVGGNLLSCIGATAFLGFVLHGSISVPAALLPMLLLTFGAGIASPTALSEALSVNPAIAGSASGLYGAAQMGIGAACAALSGVSTDPALAAGLVMLGAGLVAQLSFWVARRR